MRLQCFLNRKGDDEIPSVLRPSLALRIAKPYFASSSPSKFRDMAPVLITFDDWDKGGIFDWYREQPYTIIHKLELRKERDRFKHEFVVIYIENGWAYRIDRRPMGGPNTEVILSKGCEAEDSITPLDTSRLRVIRSETDVKIALQFTSEKRPDLYAVIAICVSVRMDAECALYTLQLYNCYFLARTIVTLLVRHHLLHCKALSGLRWDALTESSISKYIFPHNWGVLDKAMKKGVIAILDEVVWPIVKKDAELLVRNRKHWLELEETTKRIIRETVEGMDNWVVPAIQNGMRQWILVATGETLWHNILEDNLSAPQYRQEYEAAAEQVLTKVVKPKLNACLPSNMVTALDEILPKRLFHRLPSSLLALLPAEVWARIPVHVFEKAPDHIIHKAPTDLLAKGHDEFLQRLPAQTFARNLTPLVLTLPEEINRVPQRLLDESLSRMQAVLERSTWDPDRPLAMKLLKRLPDHILETLPAEIRAMRDEEVVADCSPTPHADTLDPLDANNIPRRRLKKTILQGYRRVMRVVFDGASRIIPRPVLAIVPGFVVELIPISMLKAISAEALARLPPGFFARLRAPFFERLPQELLENVPETLLKNLPRETLETLPDGFLNRLPEQLLRNVPVELLENLPENISDLIRHAIETEIFEGQKILAELAKNAEETVKEALRTSSGELSDSVIRISVASQSTIRTKRNGVLATHQELQWYILNKTRKHCKRVAQVAQLGLGEEAAYKTLCQKMENVWRVMRLHTNPPNALKTKIAQWLKS